MRQVDYLQKWTKAALSSSTRTHTTQMKQTGAWVMCMQKTLVCLALCHPHTRSALLCWSSPLARGRKVLMPQAQQPVHALERTAAAHV